MKTLIPICLFFALTGCNSADEAPTKVQTADEIVSTSATPPPAPTVSYEALMVSSDTVGPFTVTHDDLEIKLSYYSRAGVQNLMESVTQDYEYLGYLALESAYQFGPNQFVLIVSTGQSGRSCPATTYAIAFDARGENVSGSTKIEGCSEIVQVFADGNEMKIKKEAGTTVIYNAHIE